jgi:hypothetical protein
MHDKPFMVGLDKSLFPIIKKGRNFNFSKVKLIIGSKPINTKALPKFKLKPNSLSFLRKRPKISKPKRIGKILAEMAMNPTDELSHILRKCPILQLISGEI